MKPDFLRDHAVIVFNDGEDILLRYDSPKLYFDLESLNILKKKVAASIEFAQSNDIDGLNRGSALEYRKQLEKEDVPPVRVPRKGFVYVMQDEALGYIKIGFSKNPVAREQTLQGEKPTIKLLFKVECDNDVETRMHRIYKEKRVRGEWFNVPHDEAISELIKITQHV